MKRKVALFLSLVLVAVMIAPVNIFAAADKELENALNTAKSKFTIPDSLSEFSYSSYNQGSKKVWNLSWNSKDGTDGSINISVDVNGNILNYNYYKPSDYNNQRKFPAITRQQAKAKAEEFIGRISPSLLSQIKLQEDSQPLNLSNEYYFNYVRTVNGIPFPDNNVSVTVNSGRGEVVNYYMNWTDGLTFPDATKAISLEAAQKAYKEKLGLRLQYNYVYNGDVLKVYAVYAPKYSSMYYIDALTGDKVLLSPYYGYGGGGGGGVYFDNAKTESRASQNLSPQELKAIEDASKLMTQEEAEKIARGVKELELTSDFNLTNANLFKDWMFKNSFSWNLSFQKPAAQSGQQGLYASVTIDAATGEVKSFYRSTPYDANATAKYDEAASKAAVEAFLKTFKPDKYSNTTYEENTEAVYYQKMGKIPPQQYTFNYIRNVNGVPFPGNSMTATYDAVNGKVTSFNLNWFDASFPSVDKAVSLDSAYDTLFKDIGLELEYRNNYYDESSDKVVIRQPDAKSIKLVYAVKPGKPVSFDANTGVILDYNGQPYKEVKPAAYTDIAGNFAEKQITALAEYGVSLEGKEFRPNENITQADFFRLLSKTLNYYIPYSSANADKELDDIYKLLINEGIVKAGEKAPDSAVSREDAAKFIIRALKYDKVADIKGIYANPFKDAAEINPDLLGYVTIAQGLNIINGDQNGYFYPKNAVSRAQAAVILYNYLQK
ncbi:MAG: S-layer homology domain-containing protein [Clostridiales bacterium]|jgi:hypothetical protein|nr:S-layer homology domain-containing protein [Eubacteriales bacterium]MDH7567718.1 S-layer homology domain-containing protein [Clostridiales bacterium]